jgi:hypothetical protein
VIHPDVDIHPLTAAGAALTAVGSLDPSQVLPVVGPTLAIVGLVLDWWTRRQARRELDTRLTSLLELEHRLRERETSLDRPEADRQ